MDNQSPPLHPRYWLLWLVLGLLWLLTRLPYCVQMHLGAGLGKLFLRFAKRRRRIARINLNLCFPESGETERLLREHFVSMGQGLLETALAWWASDARLDPRGRVEGLEHLQAALQRGKGVILLSAHFSAMELGSRYLIRHQVIHGVYRPHENALIEYQMHKSRTRHAEKAIPRDAVREMLRSLKANKPLWFAPDQNYGLKHSVFADFFGVPAATNTATARLAQMSGAAVVPFFTHRLPDCQGYRVCLLPALTDFPSGDPQADAARVNQIIETAVRETPAQYFWMHRRFKDRPPGEAAEDFY